MRVLDLNVWCQDLKMKILLPRQKEALIFMLEDAKIILWIARLAFIGYSKNIFK